MAKHPVPKKKTSKTKTGMRYGSYARRTRIRLLGTVNLVDCSSCKEKKISHHACPSCGKYRGRQVLDMTKQIEKVTKVKA